MEESKMVLRTEDLVKKYGKRTVVSHVSINVNTVKYHMRSALDKLKEAAKSYLALIVMFITNIFN